MSQVCGSFSYLSMWLRDFIALPSLHQVESLRLRLASSASPVLYHYTSTSRLKLLLTSKNSTSFPSSHSPFPPGEQKPLTPLRDPSPQNKSRKTTNPTMPTAPRIPIILKAHLPRLNHRVVRPDPASEEQPAGHLALTHTQSEGAQGVHG
jgi:hypothetical protein